MTRVKGGGKTRLPVGVNATKRIAQ